MVRNYIKRNIKVKWSTDEMKTAIEDVVKRGISIKRSASNNKIPKTTLSKKVHDYRCNPDKEIEFVITCKGPAYSRALTDNQESLLCEYLKILDDQCIDLQQSDIRRLAFDVAEKFEVAHPFKKDSEMAGADWFMCFMKRHPEIQVKKMKGEVFNNHENFLKNKIDKFFNCLENLIFKYQLEPYDIYNLDETLVTCGVKLVTSLICFSASGSYLPLTLIFPCEKNSSIVKDAPTGAIAEFNTTGQMEYTIFLKYLKMFIKYSKASKNSPVLLIVNKYQNHFKKTELLDVLKKNGIFVICVPEDYSPKLHPIVFNFMKELGLAYMTEVRKHTQNEMCLDHIYKIFGNAYMKVSSVAIAETGFRCTGIWPVNRYLHENFDLNTDMEENFRTLPKEMIRIQSKPNLIRFALEEACRKDLNDPFIHRDQATLTKSNEVFRSISTETIELQQARDENLQNNENIVQQCIQHYDSNESIIRRTDQQIISNVYFMENQMYENHQEMPNQQYFQTTPIVIPPEAKLSEVSLHDLQVLMQNQRQLYFYVSPYRLKL